MQTIIVRYDKRREIVYNFFINDKKIRIGKPHTIESDTIVNLIEENIVLSRFWWLLIFVDMVAAVLGGAPSDWKEVRRVRNSITVRLGEITSDRLVFYFSNQGEITKIEGVNSFEIIESIQEDCPRVAKRINGYKAFLIISCLTVLLGISVAIVIAMLMKE